MAQLSLYADAVFQRLPFEHRVGEIARAGDWTEFWLWQDRDIEVLARAPAVSVSAFTRYLGGSLVRPDGAKAYLAGLRRSLSVAQRLRCSKLFISTGSSMRADRWRKRQPRGQSVDPRGQRRAS